MVMNTDERTIGETPINEIVEVPMSGKSNIILDATILTTIMSCPRLSDFRFNHNFQSIKGKSNSLEVGSTVHKFLEVYYGSIIKDLNKSMAEGHAFAAAELYIQGCKYCTDFTPSDCTCINDMPSIDGEHGCVKCNGTTKINKPTCGHKPNDYPGLFNTPKESEGYLVGWHYALDTCQEYLDFYRGDHWVPLEVEVVKGKVLYEDEDIRILWKAKLDWIVDTNQGVYPVDHKTMKQNRPTISLNNQFIGQCLMMDTRNVFINKIGFQKTLKPAEKFLRPAMSYSAARLLEWQSETLPFYAKLLLMYAESGHFPPNYTHCESKYGNCAFLEVCSSDPGMREEVLKLNFKVGEAWNPTSANDENGD
jgi:hypothetical protein